MGQTMTECLGLKWDSKMLRNRLGHEPMLQEITGPYYVFKACASSMPTFDLLGLTALFPFFALDPDLVSVH